MKLYFYLLFPLFFVGLFSANAQSESNPMWISVGENLNGDAVTYRPFKGKTACDDCSEEVALPFEFQFFGETYNKVYINSNGNLTFGSEWTEFTPSPFCLYGPKMVAPFYADADLSQCGTIDYHVSDHYLVVTWTEVCHYHGGQTHTNLQNTFQAILNDGTLTDIHGQPLPVGATVIFNYGDMQWTTGQSSGSLTGFGGAAATVGLNSGDGMTCDDYGIFDHEGDDYVGYSDDHTAPANGVSHLDYHTLFFNGNSGSYLDPETVPVSTPAPQPQVEVFTSELEPTLTAWPNPCRDQLTISFEAIEDNPAEIRIMDASGKPVYRQNMEVVIGENLIPVSLSAQPKGLYYVNIIQGTNIIGMQVVKQ